MSPFPYHTGTTPRNPKPEEDPQPYGPILTLDSPSPSCEQTDIEGDFVYLQRIEWKATLCTYSELNGRRLCVLTANRMEGGLVYLQRIEWKATLCTYSELNGRRPCVLTAN